VKSYLEAVKDKKIEHMIAQPCPAIVGYIELHHPELIRYLAPADSPMMHTMKMVREFYKEHKEAQFVIVSPCYAKRREFDEVGIGNYNVTYKSLDRYFKNNQIDLSKYGPVNYDNPPAERAVLFSTPGGLLRTAQRELPGIEDKTRKIEGQHTIYRYLDKFRSSVEKNDAPFLVDCLNCETGCNGGPGTLNQDKNVDEIESLIERRNAEAQNEYLKKSGILGKTSAKNRLNKVISRYWKKGLYDRKYIDRTSQKNSYVKIPNQAQLDDIYKRMYKSKTEDFLNCCSCGYNSCEQMANAIFNGLNKPENCRHFQEIHIVNMGRENQISVKNSQNSTIAEVLNIISTINQGIGNLDVLIENQSVNVTESSSAIEETVANISSVTATLIKNAESINMLSRSAESGKNAIIKIADDINNVVKESEGLLEISHVIQSIASQTNLLAMNAAIEAAHAGEKGKGFAVVADEVRKLAESSGDQAKTVSSILKIMKSSMDNITHSIRVILDKFSQIEVEIKAVNHQENMIANAMEEQSSGNKQIIEAISVLNDITQSVKIGSITMLDNCNKAVKEIEELKK
jgi:hypothetical protein